jgi:hypothetical protein
VDLVSSNYSLINIVDSLVSCFDFLSFSSTTVLGLLSNYFLAESIGVNASPFFTSKFFVGNMYLGRDFD